MTELKSDAITSERQYTALQRNRKSIGRRQIKNSDWFEEYFSTLTPSIEKRHRTHHEYKRLFFKPEEVAGLQICQNCNAETIKNVRK
ncbi:hypothetical protein DPMN_155524 [Dreissena polymorpha]|uniref:Uncharacterized protein n=1 Tax=Dreissena polymorpha TaxID=45954 RepID=A0A9D4JBG1_DREPO|nr:hypothetical protein DPMN_155524 [Dreissena polymorpha]